MSTFLTFPVNLSRFRIKFVVLQIILTFTVRSVSYAATVDIHSPTLSLSHEFSLRLPQSLRTSVCSSTILLDVPTDILVVKNPPCPVENLSFKLGNFSDDILSEMGVDQMRILLMDSRDALSSATTSFTVSVQPTTLFSTTPFLSSVTPISFLTPKMDRVRSVDSSTRVMTFTGPLNFLDTQFSFNHIFGISPP